MYIDARMQQQDVTVFRCRCDMLTHLGNGVTPAFKGGLGSSHQTIDDYSKPESFLDCHLCIGHVCQAGCRDGLAVFADHLQPDPYRSDCFGL